MKTFPALSAYILLSMLFGIVGLLQERATASDADLSAREQSAFLVQHTRAIQRSMAYLGTPLSSEDCEAIRVVSAAGSEVESAIQKTLDRYCIATVEIVSDQSVEVSLMPGKLVLQQGGWTNYLVKVINTAAYTGRLEIQSPNAQPLFIETRGETNVRPEEMLRLEQLNKRYLGLSLYRNAPLRPELSGSPVEYAILQIYSKRSGLLPADLDFFIGDYYRNMRLIDSSCLRPLAKADGPTGLKGEYFDNTAFDGEPIFTRIDKEIDFNWTNSSPDDSMSKQDYSIRWTGELIAPKTGWYRFGTRSNDGSRIYLEGELLVNNWGLHGTALKTGEAMLVKGQAYALLVEYFQGGGSANVKLEWDDGPLNPSRIHLQFDASPAIPVVFRIQDDDGTPSMASFTITDGIDRYEQLPIDNTKYGQTLNFGYSDYDRRAQREYEYYTADLKGIYPLPSKRLALIDPYPDQYFHAQVYRADGEQVRLPPGIYRVAYTKGPEYLTQTKNIVVPEDVAQLELSFQLERWIYMRNHGYYSSDSHIHASGCCYYTNPEEGLHPEHIWRMQLGEDLNVANILNWGANWYHQKAYFTGEDHPLSKPNYILRYNVELSGFPSSHAGHIVLLGLREDDYPETTVIEDWPTWNLPVLRWAKDQDAVTGYAHSGWGLTPEEATWALPNYALPKMNDIGANESLVTVTEGVVDFYSVGDTPAPWELNMWYHSLNCGFRSRLSGETDYPCIYDERVGEARSYVLLEDPLDYDSYLDGIKRGCGYVSDGRTHLIEFSVNGLKLGSGESELVLETPQDVVINASVAALLPIKRTEVGDSIAASGLDRQPYWHIERARIGNSREIAVELIVNGIAVDSKRITADGDWKNLNFNYVIKESSWLALRVFPSAHTNPIFALVDGKPIRNKRSAEWSRRVVDQCWKTKEGSISAAEHDAALDAFNKARGVYERIIEESP